MGMAILIDLRDGDVAGSAVEAAFDWFRRVDETFSTYKEESEISRIERGALEIGDAHEDVHTVLVRCDELRRATSGYFDVRAGGGLDPSGYVKGWAVERAVAGLEQVGARNFAIYAGGDIAIRGRPLPDDRWLVGIRHPRISDQVAAVVTGRNMAIATSGAYARGDHVIDPHTGRGATGLLSITITGPDLATADAYATAAFAMGRPGIDWAAGLDGYEAMAILPNNTTLTTSGFPIA
jgi:thiamine biosynthesis lipoprotein